MQKPESLTKEQLDELARTEFRKRVRICRRLDVPMGDLSLERVRAELSQEPTLAEELWAGIEPVESRRKYNVYTAPSRLDF